MRRLSRGNWDLADFFQLSETTPTSFFSPVTHFVPCLSGSFLHIH